MASRPAALHTFPGGLQLEANKTEPTRTPIAVMPVPEQLIVPVAQHAGTPAIAVVEVGDKVRRGQLIARASSVISANVHAPTSGTVGDIGVYPVAHPSGLTAPCIVIDADGDDSGLDTSPRDHDYHLVDPKILRQEVADAGIVGLGGAVFPSAVKLAAEVESRLHTLILNGAECEPYICCDDMLMRERAAEIVGGARVLLHILQINKCIFVIEDDKPEAHEAVKAALEETDDDRITVQLVPAVYPAGGERQLIQVLSGKQVPHDGLPMDIGYLCHNVGTAYAVGRAILHGEPLTSRIVSVCGPGIRSPRNCDIRIGTPLREAVAFCGGYTDDVSAIAMGGAMMGETLTSDEIPVVKACNCLLALTDQTLPARGDYRPCIRCGDCAEACPASLLPQQLFWYAASENIDRTIKFNLFDCIECGCCDLVCPSHIPLAEHFRYAKNAVFHRDLARSRAAHARWRFDNRNLRVDAAAERRSEKSAARKAALAKNEAVPDADGTAAPPAGDEQRQTVIEAAVARSRQKRTERESGSNV